MTKKKNQSIFQRLQGELATLIAETPPGERLLTEPKLAKQLGVSRATLREAIRTFETQGLIRRRQGSGTYVLRPPQVIETVQFDDDLLGCLGTWSVTQQNRHVAKVAIIRTASGELDIHRGVPVQVG